nr:hypothetical protein [Petrachloros mirabilis]
MIGLLAQRRMAEAAGCDRTLTLATSHNPYLSAPQAVADYLLAVAQ